MTTTALHEGAGTMFDDLRVDLLNVLPLPTALGTLYAILFTNHVFGIQPLYSWIIGLLLAGASLTAQVLKTRRPHLAAGVYVWAVGLAVLAFVGFSYHVLWVALVPAVIVLCISVLGIRSMTVLTALSALVIVGAAWQRNVLDDSVLGPLSVILLTALVSWLSHRNLVTAIEWAWISYSQARASTEEARQHRAELARTLKALDEAYYRLERFSVQLAQARETAEEARRAKQQFVASVSHELRTPLNIIIGFAEILALSPESYGVKRVPRPFMGDINRIYRSAQHLKSLIDDVLDLSQIDARHMVLITEQTMLEDVIHEAVDMVWSLASKKGLGLLADVPGNLPPVPLDRLRMRQVLLNLLSNAVRFSDAGDIAVTACLEAGEVHVTVSDSGPGIAPENLDRVFEEFHQLDSTLSRQHEGTGLGLALSRRFVELHGGRMWVESELGRGSHFHLTLPLGEAGQEEGFRGGTPLRLSQDALERARQTVLIVGDEPMAANLLRRHLQGYQVRRVAEDDVHAAVGRYLPHAVVINNGSSNDGSRIGSLMLPEQPLRVPVIRLPLPNPGTLGRGLGADSLLVKPVSREQLLDVLEHYGDAVKRVLIVDDDAQLAELIARIVRAAPRTYSVEVACGGQEGLARMRATPPDLVLLDLVMQDLDGHTLVQFMQADERLRQAHVVVMTAHDLPEDALRTPSHSLIQVEGSVSLTVTELLRCLQSLLDALPAKPWSWPLTELAADPSDSPAS
ncbi:MAG: ATP-binding response regulator [Anaerolineae bacterium]